MKKTIGLFIMAAMAVTLICCGGGAKSSDPKVVAEKFTEAFLVKFNPDEMVKYCTEDKAEEIKAMFVSINAEKKEGGTLQQLGDALGAAILMRLKELDLTYSLNQGQTKVEENNAEVFFDLASKKEADFKMLFKVDLKKDDKGDWKAYDWEMEDL